MSNTMRRILIALVIVAVAAGIFLWRSRSAATTTPPPQAAATPAAPGDQPRTGAPATKADDSRRALAAIPQLPANARPQGSLSDFEHEAEAHPDEGTALRNALFDAFADFDLFSCLPSWGLKGDITLQLTVTVSATDKEAVFSDAKLVGVEQGMQVPPETARCVAERFGERHSKAAPDAPLLPYSGEMNHSITLHLTDSK